MKRPRALPKAAGLRDLRAFLDLLRAEGELVEIEAEVNPDLEAAEVHRRVIAAGGPALLFTRIAGSPWPVVTNLFGSTRRVELAFGSRPEAVVQGLAGLLTGELPTGLGALWRQRGLLAPLLFKTGHKLVRRAAALEVIDSPPGLERLPLLRTWEVDGGPFMTLPLVYTEPPEGHGGGSNLGIYRVQRFGDQEVGLHMQIGKGGGFHLAAHEALSRAMPVNIHVGGPPALTLAGAAPLPANVPEILLASLLLGKKVQMVRNPLGPLPVAAQSEFVLVGEVRPGDRHAEGPFGDHYGYYSLEHDYPKVQVKGLCRRRNPILTATVVGKPRQEDFYIGDYLQALLGPFIRLAMPLVKDIWAYGETGYHNLAAAVVEERYQREAMAAAFRILGEGQLSLTKCLLVTDRAVDLRDFKATLEHVLGRVDLETDLYVFSNLSMDTLDYSGPKVNEGSKAVLLGLGDPVRELPDIFSGKLPQGFDTSLPFCRGCLVVSGPAYDGEPEAAARLSQAEDLEHWPMVVLVDDAERASRSTINFLWTTFTRFEPAADLYARQTQIRRHHLAYSMPLVIDARMKPSYPAELFTDPKTAETVTRRWQEYFPQGMEMGNSDRAHLD